jgi:ParB/RepB/Spo0J family partition protein
MMEEKVSYSVIEIKNIDFSPYQTREMPSETELQPLISSIRDKGLLNPILVRPHPSRRGRFELIAGQRRVLASRFLGRKAIKAFVLDVDDAGAAELCLLDNLQRQQLNAFEEALGFKILRDMGHSTVRISKIVGKSRPYVANSLRLLNLDPFVQLCVLYKTLSAWHARIILGLPEGFEEYRLADLAMDWSLSVEELRQIISDIKAGHKWVCWTRNVPISGLYKYKQHPPSPIEDQKILESLQIVGQILPISVTVTGLILNGHKRVRAAKKLGWETIQAYILFPVEYFRRGQYKPSTRPRKAVPILRGICPEMTPDQRIKMRSFSKALRNYCTTKSLDTSRETRI